MTTEIELYDVCEELLFALNKHVEEKRNTCKFDIDFMFENQTGIFVFKGSWNWQNEAETKIEINLDLDNSMIQFPDFEVKFTRETLRKIEQYIFKQSL